MFEELDYLDDINHLIGFKNEELRVIPDFNSGFTKDSKLNKLQQRDIQEESWGVTASNFAEKGDISGTHYERHTMSEIALMMPKGL